MPGLPVILQLKDRDCVVVGGGPVALRRCRALLDAGAQVRVIAPQLDADFATLRVIHTARGFEPTDLDGAYVVVAATDDPAVNQRVSAAAATRGVLVNRCDDASAGDLAIPAQGSKGPIRITVDTGGRSATAARRVRDELLDALDPVWVQWLEVVGRYREVVRQRVDDPKVRQALLKRFISDEARAKLVSDGPEAVAELFDQWIQAARDACGPAD